MNEKIAVVNDYMSIGGEKTFWNVMVEGLNATAVELGKGDKIPEDTDLVITNSLLGKVTDKPSIVLLQDNYIDMDKLFGGCIEKINLQKQALYSAKIKVANSCHIVNSYVECGKFEVIPLGIDPALFKPLNNKDELKEKYDIPKDVKVNIWVGSHHPVKGLDLIDTSKDFWILVFKDKSEPKQKNVLSFVKISQEQLVELYNCADQFVSTSRMESEGLAGIEAMFCDIPVSVTPVGIFWDWKPNNIHPREEAYKKGLDKKSMIKKWKELVEGINVRTQS